jgi:Bacterial Ig domain
VSTGIEEGMGNRLLTPTDAAGVPVSTFDVPAFVWLSEQGVEVRFASGLSDAVGTGTDSVERVLVGPGEGKSGLQFASAGEAIGVAWQEVTESGHGVIKLRGVSQEAGLLGREITVGSTASDMSHHSLSISGYSLSAAATSSTANPAAGLDLVWVASDASDAPGVGRIMMQRFGVLHGEDGSPAGLIAMAAAGQASGAFHTITHQAEVESGLGGAANDNAVWVGDEDGSGGAVGRLPTVATLDTGDVLVAWIGSEGHVHGKLYAKAEGSGEAAADYVAVNEALADLTPHYGRDGEGHAYDARRVKVGDLGPGTFALVWMVAAGADAMLNGSVFSLHADETLGHGASNDWSQTPLTTVALPAGFTGEFNLGVADGQGSDLVLRYEVVDGAGNVSTAAVAQKISAALAAVSGGKDAQAEVGGTDKADMDLVHKAAFNGNSGGSFAAEQHDSFAVNTTSLSGSEASGAPTAQHTGPAGAPGLIVAANSDGIAAIWMVAGSSADEMGLRIKIFGDGNTSSAADDGSIIDVTDNADAHVAPAVARVGDGGAAVAWVDGPSGELRTQIYTAHGQPEAAAAGITVASGHRVSDLALTANPLGPAAGGHAEAASGQGYANEFALAWIEDANADGYGSIMLQRYGLRNYLDQTAADHSPVALGRDGQVGGNDDPEQFSVDSAGTPVVGRAPQLTGLQQGQLAMSWVENDGSVETVKGAVLERDGGRAILNIDLSKQLNDAAVVAKDTHPILSSADNGDILVAWLQPEADGGFDIKAALYKMAGENVWSVPDKVFELQHFSSQPKDFSLAFAGDADPSLLLTWESSSSGSSDTGTWAQRFDLDGDSLGTSFNIGNGHADNAASDTTSLPDGSIVVVYAEQDKNGNLDIASHVVATGDSSGQAPPAGDASDVIFGDRGTLDTHAGLGDYGSLSGSSPLANDKDITVAEDATDGVIIDVLNEQMDGLRVVQVNGADLAIGAPLRIEHGFVQLRDDGDLLFTADEHFHGTVNFAYTVSNDDDQLATASVAVNVTPVEDDPMPVDLALDQATDTSGHIDASAMVADHQGHTDQPPAGAEDTQPGSGTTNTSGESSQHESEAGHQAEQQPGAGADDGATASASASDDATDTLAFAARYENGYRPGSIERQWLRLDDDANRDARGDGQGPSWNGDGAAHDNDTFVFHAAFGNDAASETPGSDHVIDLSKSGYPTFQALQDAGALVQVGADVEITLTTVDPAHPEKILLRSVSLSTLTASDFKFG